MPKRDIFSLSGPSSVRTRAALMAAGLGATMALGATGTAFAAEGSAASAVSQQADAQAKAAHSAKKAAGKKAPPAWGEPVAHYSLSATYGKGGGMWASKHSGQDFAVKVGTPVETVHGGTVVKSGPNGAGDGPAYGNAIVVKHDNNTYSQYAHLSKVDVHPGQKVKTGQRIALSGNTGNSSGPHLHFEIRTTPNYGTAINPVTYLRSEGVSV